ncbi:hypothetical protein, partial [Marinobacter sp.]|uniref:hypothetical protein n=1 Tax=Marinobacter sp. TaxID=50741 RepID=UPI001B5A1747
SRAGRLRWVNQATCRGGSVAVESVAAFAWNGWQASSGISGNLGLEYAHRRLRANEMDTDSADGSNPTGD